MAATTPVTGWARATEHAFGWPNGAAVCPVEAEAATAVPAASTDAMIDFRAIDTS